MRKFTRPLSSIVFAVLSLLPLALFTVEGPWPGPGEIKLQPRAPFPHRVIPQVFREIDRWFADRIGLRLPLLSAGAAFHVGLLRRSTDRRVVIGRDGWLFWTDDSDKVATMADFRGELRFSDAQLRAANRHLIEMRTTLSACGVYSVIAVAPNKQSIYGDYLSNSTLRPNTRLDDLLLRLDPQARAALLDLRPSLREGLAQRPELPVFFKTDTHWNEIGAFYAYRAIIEAMAKAISLGNQSLASLDDFAVEVRPFTDGDTAVYILSSPGRFADIEVRLRRKPTTRPRPPGQMLLIGDSFSGLLKGYFPPHFAKFDFGSFDKMSSFALSAKDKPGAVVFEIAERYLPDIAGWDFNWVQFCPR